MEAITYLWILIGAVLVFPIIISVLRDVDYKRQVQGKSKLRKISEKDAMKIAEAEKQTKNQEMEAIDVMANLHRRQDSYSGHNR